MGDYRAMFAVTINDMTPEQIRWLGELIKEIDYRCSNDDHSQTDDKEIMDAANEIRSIVGPFGDRWFHQTIMHFDNRFLLDSGESGTNSHYVTAEVIRVFLARWKRDDVVSFSYTYENGGEIDGGAHAISRRAHLHKKLSEVREEMHADVAAMTGQINGG